MLQKHTWPGNVRELENEVERLVALRKFRIEPEDLNPKIRSISKIEDDDRVVPNYDEFIRNQYEAELDYIKTLIRKGGSLREACRSLLSASPSTISTRLKILEKNINLLKCKNMEGNYEKFDSI